MHREYLIKTTNENVFYDLFLCNKRTFIQYNKRLRSSLLAKLKAFMYSMCQCRMSDSEPSVVHNIFSLDSGLSVCWWPRSVKLCNVSSGDQTQHYPIDNIIMRLAWTTWHNEISIETFAGNEQLNISKQALPPKQFKLYFQFENTEGKMYKY